MLLWPWSNTDNILGTFTKTVNKLEKHQERSVAKAARKRDKALRLSAKVTYHQQEANRAANAAQKIKSIVA